MRLIRGRGRQSQLLLASENVHLFAWSPQLGAASYGFTVRWRQRGTRDWTHVRLVLLQRNARSKHNRPRHGHWAARPTLTIAELARWRTENGVRDRYGLKQYLRLKAGPGGRPL